MVAVTTSENILRREKQSIYVKIVDALFYLILLASPFTHMWIDRETGEGRFLSFFILAFGILTVPVWKMYYSKWCWPIALNIFALLFGLIIDFLGYQYAPANILLIATRQLSIGIFYTLVVYNMTLRDTRNTKRFIYIILTCAIVTAIFMLFNVGIIESTEKLTTGIRYGVLGQNSNATARLMACGILISFLLLFSGGDYSITKKVFFAITIPICLLALVKSASRGGFLFLIAAFPFCMLTTRSNVKKFSYFILIAMAVCGVIFFVLHSDMLRDRLVKTFIDRDTGGREAIFYNCLALFKQSPLIGYGNFKHFRILGESIGATHIATHCMYTFPLLAMGLVGSIPYFVSFWMILKSAIRVRFYQYGNCFFVCTIFAFLSGISGNIEYLRDFYVIFGLVLALNKLTIMARPYK